MGLFRAHVPARLRLTWHIIPAGQGFAFPSQQGYLFESVLCLYTFMSSYLRRAPWPREDSLLLTTRDGMSREHDDPWNKAVILLNKHFQPHRYRQKISKNTEHWLHSGLWSPAREEGFFMAAASLKASWAHSELLQRPSWRQNTIRKSDSEILNEELQQTAKTHSRRDSLVLMEILIPAILGWFAESNWVTRPARLCDKSPNAHIAHT